MSTARPFLLLLPFPSGRDRGLGRMGACTQTRWGTGVSAMQATSPVSPALLRCAPALVLFAIVVADCARYAGTDLWGHIAFGETMLKQGRVPWLDYYSNSAPGAPYFDHEWLAQVIMAGVYDALGVVGLKLMKLALTAATII